MVEIDIRPEQAEDAPAIRALVTAAFGPDDGTADFVDAVRAEAEVCLAEVAVAGDVIVGHAQPTVTGTRRAHSQIASSA